MTAVPFAVNCGAVATNVALVEPLGTVTELGTGRLPEFDAKLMVAPVGPFTVTVHVLVPPGAIVAGVHAMLLRVTDGALRLTLKVAGLPFRVPVMTAAPLDVNCVAVVTNVALVEPLGTVTELGTGRLPELDDRLIVAPVDPLTVTAHVLAPPGATVVGVHEMLLRVTDGALRLTLKVAWLPFRVPVMTAAPLAVNCAAVATNVALVEPLGTVTELGTGRLPELDARPIVVPVDPLTVSVHVLAPPGATVAGVHEILLRVTAGALMPTVPPVPVTAIPLPAAEAAIGFVSPIAAALLPESVTDTVAMTPSPIVVAFIP